jgi:aerobic-type carbon monoxide dehydrogenase small subunit (CoxS/CutS family)
MFAVQADGCRVETVEGLADGEGGLHPLQEAFRARHALQCGFCTPGILMTLVAYLRVHQAPSEMEVREVLSGNLCRCTGYQHIVQAVLDVAGGPLTLPSPQRGEGRPLTLPSPQGGEGGASG